MSRRSAVRPLAALRAHAHEIAFILKLLPMLPSGFVDRLTRKPIIEQVEYGAHSAKLYRPPDAGAHPGVVVCLGVVPFGVDHPQVPRLSDALARAGFVTLVHWSDAMRDRRLIPEDADEIARAYAFLLGRPDVDASRSGLIGTCVGGAFALLAAARPLIRDRVTFVGAFAPFSSMWTLVRDIAGRSRDDHEHVVAWAVDPLTRDVFERTVRDLLSAPDAAALLAAHDRAAAERALSALPREARDRLTAMSPIAHLPEIRAPWIAFGHDRDDNVIPISESRRLAQALAGRDGVRFTEYAMFEHADPTKRHLSPPAFVRELVRLYASLHPVFRCAA